MADRLDLRNKYDLGMGTIKMVRKLGVRLDILSDKLRVRAPEGEYDEKDRDIAYTAIQSNMEDVRAITNHPEEVRQALATTMRRMDLAHAFLTDNMDTVDELELIYRSLYPDDNRCVRAEGFCPENAMMNCMGCAGRGKDGS